MKYWSLLQANSTKWNQEGWDLGCYLVRCRPSQKMVPSYQKKKKMPVLLLRCDLVLNLGSAPHCHAQSSASSTVTGLQDVQTLLYTNLQTSRNEMWIYDSSIIHCSTKYYQRGTILNLKHRWDVRRVVCNNMSISVINFSIHSEIFSHPQTQDLFMQLDEWLKLWASFDSDDFGLGC